MRTWGWNVHLSSVDWVEWKDCGLTIPKISLRRFLFLGATKDLERPAVTIGEGEDAPREGVTPSSSPSGRVNSPARLLLLGDREGEDFVRVRNGRPSPPPVSVLSTDDCWDESAR